MAQGQGEILMTKEALQEILKGAIESAKNPEQKAQEQEAAIRRENKARAAVALREAHGADPEGAKKKNCTHTRHPMTMGKLGGHTAPRGQGELTTGAQMHSDGTATVICQRCSADWHFKPTADEVSYIVDGGGSGMTPPDLHWPGTSPRLIHN